MFSWRLTAPHDTIMTIGTSRDVKYDLENYPALKFVGTCAANCDLRSLSHTVSFWTTCYMCGLFRRILCTAVCGIFKSALAWEIDFFGLRTEACITRSTSSSNFQAPNRMYFSTMPVFLNFSYHLLMLLLPCGLTPHV
jgi:hypothetical protein